MTNDSVFEAIAEIAMLPTKFFKLTAINSAIPFYVGGRGRTHRLIPTDLVSVDNDRLIAVTENSPATHIVTECRGSLYIDLFEITVRDLKTDELLTIKL